MTTAIVKRDVTAMTIAGQVANQYAASGAFADYTGRKSDNTLRAQRADLATWSVYLCAATNGAACPDAETLQYDPAAWHDIHNRADDYARNMATPHLGR